MKLKSAIFFSIFLTILSRPLGRKVPELVRTLHVKGKHTGKIYDFGSFNNAKEILVNTKGLETKWEIVQPAVFTLSCFTVYNR